MKFSCFSVILLISLSLEVAYARDLKHTTEDGENFDSLENNDVLPLFNETNITPSTDSDSNLSKKEVHDTRCPEQIMNISINFANMRLEHFTEDTIETLGAVFLNLSYNGISSLPPSTFKKIPNLQGLDLSANFLKLEHVLKNRHLSNLVSLYIDNNKEYDYYRSRYESTSMRTDDLKYSGIEFPKLEQLYLRDTTGINFPVSLNKFAPGLIHLDLSGNDIETTDFLQDAPKTLTHLILDRNIVTDIPKNVFENLTKLSLAENDIENLCFDNCFTHNSILLDGAKKLEWLNLSGNNIRFYVDSATNLPPLRYLDLSNNSLTGVPFKANAFQYLEHLVFSHNTITSVPDMSFAPKLKYLDLSHNQISVLQPGLWCEHNTLEKLKLNGNIMKTIDAGAFDTLDVLVDLDLSENQLKSFSNGWIPAKNHLEILRLNYNKITNLGDIPLYDLTTLKELHLQGNPLTHFVQASIADLPMNCTIFI